MPTGPLGTVLGTLTTRGRAFVAAGVGAIGCAVALGFGELIGVGVLLLALPTLSALLVSRGRHRLALTRTVEPSRVTAGGKASVRLALSNESPRSTGLLLLEEQLPYALGGKPRFVVERMGGRWRRELRYDVRADVRGRYHLGPLLVRVVDPLGLVELDRTFTNRSSLVVTPRIAALPPVPLSGSWTGAGDNRPRDFAGGSAEDVTVREYRHGDELRRVHWRASAHTGELMVRREEQPWQSRATLMLDNRLHSHRGAGPASSLEHAVTLAASIALHLTQRDFAVRLVTADGAEHAGWHDHGSVAAEAGPLLESLAVLQPSDRARADTSWLGEGRSLGLLVAVLGEVSTLDENLLRRLRHAASAPTALVLDVSRWGPPAASAPRPTEPTPSAAPLLASQGWRVVTVDPADPPARTWEQLGRQTSAGRRVSAGSGIP